VLGRKQVNKGRSAENGSSRLHQPPNQPKLECPQCTSERLYKAGMRYLSNGESIQRWLCRDCCYRFSEKRKTNKALQKNRDWQINTASDLVIHCQERGESHKRRAQTLQTGGLTLVTSETRQESAQREGTTDDEAFIKGRIVQFISWQEREGYRPSTAHGRIEIISNLARRLGPQLFSPEAVKEYLAKLKRCDGYKSNIVDAYTAFLVSQNQTWKPPRYKAQNKLPFIPLETELDQLTSAAGRMLGPFLQGLKETGADPGELAAAEWTDLNPQTKTIVINHPVKGHKSRILNISNDWIAQLNILPKSHPRIFPSEQRTYMRSFYNVRKRMARRLANPRLMKIVFTTFRHWKATMEYHKTKDILYVMQLLGHNSLKTTLIYIDIEKATFKNTNDEFTVRVTDDLEEACKFLEVGFEYVTDMDGKKVFRKRK
jgi:integrase/transposase-like protein